MAGGTRTLKLRFEGESKGLRPASLAGVRAVKDFANGAQQASGKVATASSKMGTTFRAAGRMIGAAAKAAALAVAAVGIAAGAAAFRMGRDAIKAASDLEESLNAVDKIFGRSKRVILDWGKQNANSFGLSRRAFHELAVPLGAGLKNAGLGLDDTAKTTIKLTERASDMASVFNTEVADALQAIQAGLRGEADPLERFGVGLSAARVQARALADTGKANASALTEQEKMLARVNLIMEQTADTAGDFRDTSDGLANSQRIAAARSEEMQAKIGKQLAPALRLATQLKLKLLTLVAEKLVPALMRFSRWIRDEAAPAIRERFGPAFLAVGRWIRDDFWPALQAVWDWLSGTAIPALAGFATTVRDNFEGPLRKVRAFIAKHVLPLLQQFFGAIIPKLKAAFDDIKTAVDDLNIEFKHIKPVLMAVGAVFLTAVAAAVLAVVGAVTLLTGVIRIAASIFRNVTVPAFNAARSAASSLGRGISSLARGAADRIRSMARKIKSFTRGLWNGIRSGLAGAVNWVIGKINGLINRINAIPGVDLSRIPRVSTGGSSSRGLRARAHGGPVLPGQTYLVGERGPELLTMGAQGGHVTPNSKISPPIDVHVHVEIDGKAIDESALRVINKQFQALRRRVIQGGAV